MANYSGYFVSFIAGILLGMQVNAAYGDHMLTVGQMNRSGRSKGLPFVWHMAMWSNILFCPWYGNIFQTYHQIWNPWTSSVVATVSIVVAFLIHWLVYRKGDLAEAHAHDGKLTIAGWLHMPFMAMGFWLFTMLFIFTPRDFYPWIVNTTSVLIVVDITLALHFVPALRCWYKDETWYTPQPWPWKKVANYVIFVVTVSLVLYARRYHFTHIR